MQHIYISNYADYDIITSPPSHIGPFHGVILLVLEIKNIHQCIVNNVNLSVLKLENHYLHQNGVEFNQNALGINSSIPPAVGGGDTTVGNHTTPINPKMLIRILVLLHFVGFLFDVKNFFNFKSDIFTLFTIC